MTNAKLPGELGVVEDRPATLAEGVYAELARRIRHSEYVPDSRLPSEHDLARSFQVSRPVVRKALFRLREDGLIYSRQGAGSFVAGAPVEAGIAFRPAESIADIQRGYEFRETIETKAAELAAMRRNDAVVEQLDNLLRRLQRATANGTHRDDIDFEFHLTIAKASNNQYFPTVLLALRDQIAAGMKLHGLALLSPSGRLEQTTDEHAAIVDAIRAGDPQGASELMRAHLRNSRDRLFGGSLLDLRL